LIPVSTSTRVPKSAMTARMQLDTQSPLAGAFGASVADLFQYRRRQVSIWPSAWRNCDFALCADQSAERPGLMRERKNQMSGSAGEFTGTGQRL
jgi:hypothetical protein